MAVRVVTDSTADLPGDVAAEMGITVVPLNVLFGNEVFCDGVDISADQFFHTLQSSTTLPKTSQPSVGTFLEAYAGYPSSQLLSVHVSSKLSGTVNSADLAAQQSSYGRVRVLDSRSVSVGLAIIAICAAKKAREGAGLQEVAAYTQSVAKRVHCIVMVDTLEYLQRGGRIGKASAFLGSALNIKPILSVEDGEVHPLERVRTRAKALERMLEIVAAVPRASEPWVIHSTTPADAEAIAGRLASHLKTQKVRIGRFGPVLGTYVGPGALGMAVLEGQQ